MNKLRLLTLLILFHATSSIAGPILSVDGRTLTALDVNGVLYDVAFGDVGRVGAVFAGIIFDTARHTEANAVSAAIVTALNDLGAAPQDIFGCEHPMFCTLFNPDSAGGELPGPSYGHFTDNMYASYDPLSQLMWEIQGGSIGFSRSVDATNYTPSYTLVRFAPSSPVPVSPTLALFGLGLAGLGWTRRNKA